MSAPDYQETFQLDLPLSWVVALPDDESLCDRPLVAGDEAVARYGDGIGGFALADGSQCWQVAVADGATDADCLLPSGDLFITDHRKRPQRTVSFAAARRGGPVVWRVDTGGVILRESVALCGDDLLVVSGGKSEGKMLRLIDAATGQVRSASPMGDGVTTALSVGDFVFVSSSTPGQGLVRIGPDGQKTLEPRALQALAGRGERLAALTRDGQLQLRDALGVVRWSAPASGDCLAFDTDEVLSFEGDPARPIPVLRGAVAGEERWRGAELPDSAVAASLIGPVALVNLGDGVVLLDRSRGVQVATGTGLFRWGGALAGRSLVLGCQEFLLRAELPASV